MTFWRLWKYKNLTLVFGGLIAALILSQVDALHQFLLHLGSFGYIGAFVAGMLFVSTFSAVTGVVILLILAETMSAFEIGIIAGAGAVLGDLTIFRFVKDHLANELEDIYNHLDHRHHFIKILHSKYFSWTLPVIGAIIIASPLPDEMGVSLLVISKMRTYQFIAVSFLLNAIGIFLVVSASLFIKP